MESHSDSARKFIKKRPRELLKLLDSLTPGPEQLPKKRPRLQPGTYNCSSRKSTEYKCKDVDEQPKKKEAPKPKNQAMKKPTKRSAKLSEEKLKQTVEASVQMSLKATSTVDVQTEMPDPQNSPTKALVPDAMSEYICDKKSCSVFRENVKSVYDTIGTISTRDKDDDLKREYEENIERKQKAYEAEIARLQVLIESNQNEPIVSKEKYENLLHQIEIERAKRQEEEDNKDYYKASFEQYKQLCTRNDTWAEKTFVRIQKAEELERRLVKAEADAQKYKEQLERRKVDERHKKKLDFRINKLGANFGHYFSGSQELDRSTVKSPEEFKPRRIKLEPRNIHDTVDFESKGPQNEHIANRRRIIEAQQNVFAPTTKFGVAARNMKQQVNVGSKSDTSQEAGPSGTSSGNQMKEKISATDALDFVASIQLEPKITPLDMFPPSRQLDGGKMNTGYESDSSSSSSNSSADSPGRLVIDE